MRIIALLASAVGKLTTKLPAVDVLSAPKSKIATAGSPDADSLKIMAPLAVMVAFDHVVSAKSHTAVVELATGVTEVNVFPLAV